MKLLLVFVALALAAKTTRWHQLDGKYSYSKYVAEFNKEASDERKAIFEERLALIMKHNAGTDSTYKKGVNRFTDMTVEERKQFFGLDRASIYQEDFTEQVKRPNAEGFTPPMQKDWRDEGVISTVKDQGQCGSCWTFGSSETIESYAALASGDLPVLSQQMILDCTANPNSCGGTGGCGGATATIAINSIISLGGLASEWTYPYSSYFGTAAKCQNGTLRAKPFVKVKSQIKLPSNEQEAVLQTISQTGPLIVNVDASSWQDYEAGVYDGCGANATIDHVVQLVGFGHDAVAKSDFWIVRNSWAPSWGEEGFIRLARPATAVCGYDNSPLEGNGCNGGPPDVKVCGQCGILFATSYVEMA